MKSKQEIKQAWANLATAPEFEDCLADLLRYVKFWKPLSGSYSDGEHRESSAQRSVLTYILKQTSYPSIDVDLKQNEDKR